MRTTTRTGPAGAGTAGRQPWRTGEHLMLRVAGLPAAAVDGLRCPGAADWARRVLDAEAGLGAEAEELGEVLHRAVALTDPAPDGPGVTARRALLGLRRKIHNGRVPDRAEEAVTALAGLDPAGAVRLTEWLERQARFRALLAEGEGLLADDLTAGRRELAGLLEDDRLRLGLLLASPVLEGRLGPLAEAAATGAEPRGRARKAERAVLSYVYRTACKTSPFSTFTALATGRAVTAGEAGTGPVRVADIWTGHVRLNVVVLARIAELVLADPVRRRDLPLRPASGWGWEGERVRYVRKSVAAGDDDAAVTFDAATDRLFFLRRSGTLDRLLALFATRGELRHHELTEWLAAEHGAGPEECEAYVDALRRLGMVRVPCLDTVVHGGDPLTAFRTALAGLGAAWADRLAESLAGPAAVLERYPAAGRDERRALLAELRAGLRRVQEELGAGAAGLPQTLVYEDVSAGADLPVVLPALDSLRSVERILPAFDLTLAQRITFEGFFTARYGEGGRCEDLLGLVHDFHEDFFDQYLSFTGKRRPYDEHGEYVPEENWLGLPGIRALDAARRTFTGRMRAAWAAYGDPTGAAELRLTEPDIAAVAAELVPIERGFTPRAHHLQFGVDPVGGEPRTVLNRAYGGLSFPFSRFTHVYEDAAGPRGAEGVPERPADGAGADLSARLRAANAAAAPPGAVLAEVTGGPVTTNLNLHGRLTEYEIVCPGETGTLPEDRRLDLDDLYAEHDPTAGRVVLRSHRLGREVIPVYLGYLVPLALPAIPRTLLLLSPSSMSPLDVWAGVPREDADGPVRVRPRVVHGDLVLARRSWTTTAGDLPARGARSAADFLDWQRWRTAHGLPERVFATVAAAVGPAAGAKPQYVDFASLLSLETFEALLGEGTDRVVFRELLPDTEGLPVRSARGGHVTEFAVETFGSPAAGPAAFPTTDPHQEGPVRCPS
ncbi:lantibiotic dehydratase [Streptomyces sp. NPDC097619]|uniref:lantibiotic dehydratase n=1 Tax=Streptomyces sp. NPDC097619 TaxID=3157228 RepID=UPI00332875C9